MLRGNCRRRLLGIGSTTSEAYRRIDAFAAAAIAAGEAARPLRLAQILLLGEAFEILPARLARADYGDVLLRISRRVSLQSPRIGGVDRIVGDISVEIHAPGMEVGIGLEKAPQTWVVGPRPQMRDARWRQKRRAREPKEAARPAAPWLNAS